MENVRVYEIPSCKMVASQCGMFGDGKLEVFDKWMSAQPRTIYSMDFLTYDGQRGGFVWYYVYSEGMELAEGLEVVDFAGGLYAVTCDVDGQDNQPAIAAIKEFITQKGCFAEDNSRGYLGHVTTPKSAQKAMGYAQMDYYVPIKVIEK